MASKPAEPPPSPDKEKKCFFITPIGDGASGTRRLTDGLLASVIRPVLHAKGFKVKASHEVNGSGSISIDIIRRLLEADLVIANLTDLNPNVMYELAVRHAKRLPVVCIAHRATPLPFDIAHERTIFFDNDFMGVDTLKPQLSDEVDAAMAEDKPDNPIYRAAQEIIIRADAKDGDALSIIMDRLDSMEGRISAPLVTINKTRSAMAPGWMCGYLLTPTTEEKAMEYMKKYHRNSDFHIKTVGGETILVITYLSVAAAKIGTENFKNMGISEIPPWDFS